MRNAILYLLLILAVRHVNAQPQEGQDFPASCHAFFAAAPDAGNPMLFHFHDQSTGQINHWQWSFGDGATSTVQNPSHLYAAGGTYFVCLTVSDSDSGNICHDMLCFPVTVHQPGACVADYICSIDSLNQLAEKFTDKSTGNINSWHWDFGDGTVSADRNPHHTFPAFGKYKVCLTAYNSDSVSVCNDVKCDSVTLLQTETCHARFVYELDSLNHESNTFKFKDTSTGNPNHYLWSFDDGASLSTRDVSHQFHVEGTHKVCLTIVKEGVAGTICSDSSRQMVKTAKYFNVGGHLFAGAFPINNPISTGDTGVAYIYRQNGSRLTVYDSTKFTSLGYYAFPRLLNGYYVLRAELTPGSANYDKFFPAYYAQSMKWKDAGLLNLTDTSSFEAHVYLVPFSDQLTGSGSIKGKVSHAGPPGNPFPISNAEVILYTGQMAPVNFTRSEKSGLFEFDDLPFGAYYLYVEIPGKYSRLTPVWLDATKPVAGNMQLDVFDYDVTGITGDNSAIVKGELYPDPASTEVNLRLNAAGNSTLSAEIRSMAGQVVASWQTACMKGNNLFTFPITSIAGGIYLFTVRVGDGSPVLTKKLVKY